MSNLTFQHTLRLSDALPYVDTPEAIRIAARTIHERLEVFRKEYFFLDGELAHISDEFFGLGAANEEFSSEQLGYVLQELVHWGIQSNRVEFI